HLFSPSRECFRILILLLGSLLLFGAGIGMRSLWNPNEPVYAEGTREMLAGRNFYLPTVNGLIYSDKPVFYFWTMLAGCLLTGGISEAGLRLPSVISGVLSVLLLYRLGRQVFGIRAGFLAAACLATMVMFWWHSQYIQMDQLLSFLILGALATFFTAKETAGPRRGLLLFASGACMGLAFLTKGPVGLVLPAAIIGIYLVSIGDPAWIFRKEILGMGAAFLLTAAPWYLSLAFTGNQEVLADFFIKHNLQRATDPFNHRQPFWYYGPRLFSDLFPWSLFLPFALFCRVRNEMERRGRLLAWIWLGVVLLVFSLAGSKRGVYLLPLYPAAALLLGKFWDELLEPESSERMRRWARGMLGFLGIFFLLAGAGCLGVVGYALATGKYRDEAVWLAPLGGLVLLGAGVLIRFLRAGRVPQATSAVGLTMAAVFLYSALVIFPLADRFKSPVPFCRQVKALVPPSEEIRSFGLWRWDAAYIFYTGRLMPALRSTEELETYLAQDRRVFLLVESSEMDQFLSGLRSPARVVLRQNIGHKTTALLTNRSEESS
ncbi:MAG TPA: glycosyltransferase family 39 protein, partial [Candidatus Polarisedimenticolia bacterium]|nr:glycosyltransferase family 39 protein [Candidatus Polarisedimenticolia bacterium]